MLPHVHSYVERNKNNLKNGRAWKSIVEVVFETCQNRNHFHKYVDLKAPLLFYILFNESLEGLKLSDSLLAGNITLGLSGKISNVTTK